VLDERALPHLVRPVGRPPKKGYEKVIDLGGHAAENWKHAQRSILVVVDPTPRRANSFSPASPGRSIHNISCTSGHFCTGRDRCGPPLALP